MRLELFKPTDLSLQAMEALAGSETGMAGSKLAAAIGTTTNYLPQVMKPLVGAGWVLATSGPRGGYLLTADVGEVSILDIVEAVEGPTETGPCVLKGAPCPTEDPCAFHFSWVRARDALVNELGATPLGAALRLIPVKGE
jgi:Rrf2 family protein